MTRSVYATKWVLAIIIWPLILKEFQDDQGEFRSKKVSSVEMLPRKTIKKNLHSWLTCAWTCLLCLKMAIMSPITVIPMSCKISWKKGVKSRIELIVLLFVRSTLSYMQIKSLFASNVNAHSASNYRTLSPLRPDTTSPPFFLVWLKVPVNSVPGRCSCTCWSSWPSYCSMSQSILYNYSCYRPYYKL